jgi:hypothetical protein
MTTKERLSASVDAALMQAAREAVAEGRAPSLSAWINDALRIKCEHDRRMAALSGFVASFEAEFGEISDEEMRDATRSARSRARVVRPKAPKRKAP